MRHEISQTVHQAINSEMPIGRVFGYQDGSRYFYSDEQVSRYLNVGVDVNQISLNLYQKDLIEHDLLPHKQYQLYKYIKNQFEALNKEEAPFDIIFNLQLDRFLYKGAVSYDHRGRPIEVTYYEDDTEAVPVVKRVFEFTDFEKNTIMQVLGVDEATASSMEDRLMWTRKECFLWAFEDGVWSDSIKEKYDDYVPFVGGFPDYARYYERRVEERKVARQSILDRLQPDVVSFIAEAIQSNNLDDIRAIGRDFLQKHSSAFYEYIQTGDELVINNIIADTESAMLDYATGIEGVDVRQYMVNILNQTGDVTLPIL